VIDGAVLRNINLRDVGGHTTADGRLVREGLVFRSGQISGLSADARQALATLGLGTVFDLRTPGERQINPDELPPGVATVVVDVLADDERLAPAKLNDFMRDLRQVEEAMGDGKAAALMEDTYRRFVSLPSACRGYGQVLTALADEATGPALLHCTAGKDRTGWGTAVLLLVLGVPESAVVRDFLTSNAHTVQEFQPEMQAFTQAGGDPTLLAPFFSVADAYLTAALDQAGTDHGDFATYVTHGLGLTPDVQARLRHRLLA